MERINIFIKISYEVDVADFKSKYKICFDSSLQTT